MEYKVIQENSILGLENELNKLLKEGWQPQGGIFRCRNKTGYGTNEYFYLQAIIKK